LSWAAIPIAVFTLIDAGTASLSPFQRTPKIVHDHAGIRFRVRLESAFTFDRNMHLGARIALAERIDD
jgi:hypothetical protein